jgi:hypothetical protein
MHFSVVMHISACVHFNPFFQAGSQPGKNEHLSALHHNKFLEIFRPLEQH